MSYEQYVRELTRLREVLKDACNRGDYYLEFDVCELIEKLNEDYDSKNPD